MARFCSLVTALIFGLALVSPVVGDDAGRSVRPTVFPGSYRLESRWEAFRSDPRAAKEDAVQKLILDDLEGRSLVKWGEDRYTSIWSGIDRHLLKDSDLVTELRKQHEAQARIPLEAARRTGDLPQVLAVYRRFPWSRAVHEALIEHGEQALRRGHAGLALRCFDDALTHTADPTLRRRAQVGVWCALAQESRDRALLEAAFQGVAADSSYPWQGGEAKDQVIRERLLGQPEPPAPAVKLADLDLKLLKVPAAPAWSLELPPKAASELRDAKAASFPIPMPHAGGVLVGGPNLLARYDDDLTKPRWMMLGRTSLYGGMQDATAPGVFQPIADGGRIYTRWGIASSQPGNIRKEVKVNTLIRQLKDLVAIDARNGDLLWSTARDPGWEELEPLTDPALAEGRLYVLAAHRGQEYTPIHLVCLAAETGAVLWKRELVTNHLGLSPTDERGRPKGRLRFREHLDLAHFGNAVTVARGAVYCLTNTGVVARCDARDGAIEWARSYPREARSENLLGLMRRLGASPLVLGRKVVFMPRDALGFFVVQADTGELIASNNEDASRTLLGNVGERVLLADARRVAAYDLGAGKLAWEKSFDHSIEGRVALLGSSLYVGTPEKLYRLAAETGEALEERAWDQTGPMTTFALRGNQLIGTSQGSETAISQDPSRPLLPARTDQPLRTVYRTDGDESIRLDGNDDDWPADNTFSWTGANNRQGKHMLRYDVKCVYLGVVWPVERVRARTGKGLDATGTWLELTFKYNDQPVRLALGVDARGEPIWEPLSESSLPLEAMARFRHHATDGRLVVEIAVPWPSIVGEKDRKAEAWRRMHVGLVLHEDTDVVAVIEESVQFHKFSRQDEGLVRKVARLLPHLEESRPLLEADWWHRLVVDPLAVMTPADASSDRTLAVLQEHLPKMRFTDYSARLFQRADSLLLKDAKRRTDFRRAILTKSASEDALKWVDAFILTHVENGEKDYLPALDELLQQAKVPDEVLAEFRRQTMHAFVRSWQLLGPFPNPEERGHDIAYPPEKEIILAKEYDGIPGKIRWQPHHSDTDKIDLARFFARGREGVAYGVCWIRSDQKRRAVLETGSDDGIKLWLNDQLVVDHKINREAAPAQDTTEVELPAGWTRLLIKIDNRPVEGRWCFYVEFRDPQTGKPLDGLAIRTTPPEP